MKICYLMNRNVIKIQYNTKINYNELLKNFKSTFNKAMIKFSVIVFYVILKSRNFLQKFNKTLKNF